MVRIDGKWGALASAVPLELVCGLQYSFAVYSEALKERHGLSEAQIAFIGAMVVFGNSVLGVLAGAAFDRLSARLKSGPRICCLVSLALALCTYPPLWAIASGSWTPAGGPNVATAFLSAFACLSALCGSVCDVVAMGVSVTNFPQHRGQVVGQLKAFVGLSSSFHLVLYAAIPRGDSSNYILLQVGGHDLIPAFHHLAGNCHGCKQGVGAKEMLRGRLFCCHSWLRQWWPRHLGLCFNRRSHPRAMRLLSIPRLLMPSLEPCSGVWLPWQAMSQQPTCFQGR